MDTVIEQLPGKVREKLNMKAKASGRSIEAEAAAILSNFLGEESIADEMDELQKMVHDMYGGKRPEGEVDRFVADRKLEAAAEAVKLR